MGIGVWLRHMSMQGKIAALKPSEPNDKWSGLTAPQQPEAAFTPNVTLQQKYFLFIFSDTPGDNSLHRFVLCLKLSLTQLFGCCSLCLAAVTLMIWQQHNTANCMARCHTVGPAMLITWHNRSTTLLAFNAAPDLLWAPNWAKPEEKK